jgi:hypothetical protein
MSFYLASCILGVPLFSLEVFLLSQQGKVAITRMLSRRNNFVECEASFASDFDGDDECFGEGSSYYCFGVTKAPPH